MLTALSQAAIGRVCEEGIWMKQQEGNLSSLVKMSRKAGRIQSSAFLITAGNCRFGRKRVRHTGPYLTGTVHVVEEGCLQAHEYH